MNLHIQNFNSSNLFDASINAAFESVNPSSVSNDASVMFHYSHPAILCVSNFLMNDSAEENIFRTWHLGVDHQDIRDTMVDCINHLILQRRPSASSDWMSKLPLVSKQVEKKLYHYADSIDE